MSWQWFTQSTQEILSLHMSPRQMRYLSSRDLRNVLKVTQQANKKAGITFQISQELFLMMDAFKMRALSLLCMTLDCCLLLHSESKLKFFTRPHKICPTSIFWTYYFPLTFIHFSYTALLEQVYLRALVLVLTVSSA